MDEKFKKALKFVLKWEGGYSNHPYDPGGATNKGITQRVYDAWRESKKLPKQDVRKITDAEVEQIYWERYWTPLRASELPEPLDLVAFDSGVNCGVERAAKWLQSALKKLVDSNITIDGKVGKQTVAAAQRAAREGKALQVAATIIDTRENYYRQLAERHPTLAVFLKGWLNRINDLRKTIGLQVKKMRRKRK